MFSIKLYEPKEGGEGWRRVGQITHPATDVTAVASTLATGLTKMGKDATRVQRIVVERVNTEAGFTLKPPVKSK